MASGYPGEAVRQIGRLFRGGAVGGLADGELLGRFAAGRGEAAEAAFEALVARHGPMVHRACRGLLRDSNDVDDAFQATFLVLVRRAGSIAGRESLGPWLHGVALRVARKARSVAARRRGREGGIADDPPAAEGDATCPDLRPILHEELGRLPEKYRRPIVLCHLQGLTHAEAARELAWPVGTVSVRLARARRLLRDRLARRGLTAGAAPWGAGLAADAAPAAVPEALIRSTTMAARSIAAGKAVAAGMVPAGPAALAQGVLTMMLLSKMKWIAALVLAGAGTVGAVALAQGTPSDTAGDKPTRKAVIPPERGRSPSEIGANAPEPPAPDEPEPPPTIPPSLFDLQSPANRGGAGSPLAPPTVKPGQTICVEVLEALPGRPITGERIIGPDGTIGLGFYGDLYVDGLTRTQIKVKVIEHLRKLIKDETLGLTKMTREGKVVVVPPAESNKVFVDDTVDLVPARERARRSEPGAEDLRDRVEDLEAKLDRVLRELNALRRQPRQPGPRDAGKVPPR